ncbi:class I SAM-dependent methyltransferase [Acidocella sp.]|uniref:class I SAM-dependent methyltransferase n=1 Tax=Acidocella sp. TaxID=50710 RepID=UPI00260FD1B5|nr:class I SAM-dependent methyltransferase [Acidocella sp.]
MAIDARDVAGFYASPLGRKVAARLGAALSGLWPQAKGLDLLGLGFTGPYLPLWAGGARRVIAFSPAAMGPAPWPAGRPGLACTGDEDSLPFPDLSFDRILIVHGLEHADSARRYLREAWRLLRDDGRLIVVTPSRRGLWAYAERTPFGHGEPYSERQIARLLTSAFFQVEAQRAALYAPPVSWPPVLSLFGATESLGARLAPHFAGITIAEASKAMHGLIPAGARRAGRRVFADLTGSLHRQTRERLHHLPPPPKPDHVTLV